MRRSHVAYYMNMIYLASLPPQYGTGHATFLLRGLFPCTEIQRTQKFLNFLLQRAYLYLLMYNGMKINLLFLLIFLQVEVIHRELFMLKEILKS